MSVLANTTWFSQLLHTKRLALYLRSSRYNLTGTITLPSEDTDWLEFRALNFEVDPNISRIFAILSGSLGSSSEDDRYRLANGSDDLITNLKADTWNDFVSHYCMIYDSSIIGQTVGHGILAWVRFKESENVKFQDVGPVASGAANRS